MQVSNILSLLKTKQFDLDQLFFKHNPFLELADGTYEEIYVEAGKYRLVEKSKPSLPFEVHVPKIYSDITELAEDLLPNRKIILSVSTDLCFQHVVQFPISARSKIDQLSQLELLRVTPFGLADVYCGCILIGENATTVFAQQFVLKKSIISEIEKILLQQQRSIEAIFIRDLSGKSIELAFAPNGEHFGRQLSMKWKKRLCLSLGLLAITGAALVGSISSFHARQLDEISVAIAGLQPEIKKVKQIIENSEKQNANVAAIQNLQRQTISRVTIIEELTKALPDTAYILTLSIVDNRVQMEGLAESPEKLIPTLESTSLFKNVVFGSAVFNSAGESQSHFAINMDLEQPK
jgi:Tfp pilus assembly protein PilN